MGVCFIAVAVAVFEWSVYAVVDVADGLSDQSASQRNLPVEYGCPGCIADLDDGQPLASGHLCDGHRLYLIKYRVDVCLAFLRQETDGVWAFAVLEGHRALCAGCCWRDGDHGLLNTVYS